MQSFPAEDGIYNGGVFQFIPFNGTTWIPTLVHHGFMQIRIQVMLSAVICLILIQLFLLLRRRTRCLSSKSKQLTHHNHFRRSAEQMFPLSQETSSTESTASCSSLALHESAKAKFECVAEELRREFSKHLEHFEDASGSVELLEPVVATNTELAVRTASESSYKPLIKKARCQDTFRSPMVLKTRQNTHGLHRRIISLSVVAAFFAICFIAHVTSLIVAIKTDHTLTELLEHLPARSHRIAIQASGFVDYSLDSAYNLTRTHIRNDAARSDGMSHLRFVVERAKLLGSYAVTCLIQPCTVFTNSTKKILLFPVSHDQVLESAQLQTALLTTFNLVLSRLTALSEASVALNNQMIQNTERAWYEYRQGLSGIVPMAPVGIDKHGQRSMVDVSWTSSTILNRTRYEICANLERIERFTSCAQVDTFLQAFVLYANSLTTMLPRNSLESVMQFASMPRALHAEQLVEDWLPVITDLPGQGVLFLLENYLLPEINRLKVMLTRFTANAPEADLIEQFTVYTRYFNSAMILVFALLFVCGLLLLSTTCFFIFRVCAKSAVWTTDQFELDELEIMSRGPEHLDHKCYPSVRRGGRVCLRTMVPIFVMVTCIILAIFGCALSYASILIETDACLYVYRGSAQYKADLELTKGLYKLLTNFESLQSLLAVPYLNLAMPYPILNTLDSEYRPGQISLLSSLHMNRPCNFTALLHSDWFNRTLMQLWDKDVRAKLRETDLASKIPKIPLLDVYNQVIKSMQLEKSFDQLSVGQLQEYLNNPGPAYVTDLHRVLVEIDSAESRPLATIFGSVSSAYETYAKGYAVAEKNLIRIRENKQLIAPVSSLVANASIALNQLNQLNNSELISLIDQVIIVGWPQFLPTVIEQLVPFMLRLFDDLIPYPGLQPIYREAVGIVCPVPNDVTTVHVTAAIPPLNPELNRLGSGLFASAVTLNIAGLLSLMIP